MWTQPYHFIHAPRAETCSHGISYRCKKGRGAGEQGEAHSREQKGRGVRQGEAGSRVGGGVDYLTILSMPRGPRLVLTASATAVKRERRVTWHTRWDKGEEGRRNRSGQGLGWGCGLSHHFIHAPRAETCSHGVCDRCKKKHNKNNSVPKDFYIEDDNVISDTVSRPHFLRR